MCSSWTYENLSFHRFGLLIPIDLTRWASLMSSTVYPAYRSIVSETKSPGKINDQKALSLTLGRGNYSSI